MAGQQQNAKKGKSRRVDKGKIARYWNTHHPANMTRRAIRVFNSFIKMRKRQHKDLAIAEQDAAVLARRCASAHGPMVEGPIARFLKEQTQ